MQFILENTEKRDIIKGMMTEFTEKKMVTTSYIICLTAIKDKTT